MNLKQVITNLLFAVCCASLLLTGMLASYFDTVKSTIMLGLYMTIFFYVIFIGWAKQNEQQQFLSLIHDELILIRHYLKEIKQGDKKL